MRFLATLFSALLGFSLHAQVVQRPHTQVELVASTHQVRAGQTLLVGLRIKAEEHWHTYWRNPGDSGEATKIEWKLPAGFAAGPILWPPPERIPVPPLVNFGYSGETFLLTEMAVGARPAGAKEATLRAQASWLVCRDVCIPGKADLTLVLPWTEGKTTETRWYGELDRVRTSIPSEMPQWKSEVAVTAKDFRLTLHGPAGSLTGAEYYPFSETLIQNAADQKVTVTGDKIVVETIRSQFADEGEPKPQDMEGIVLLKGAQPTAILVAPQIQKQMGLFWEALLFAFLGGLILNLMPCVFPVLCLKVLSFAEMAGAARRKAVHHSGAYTMGILVSFWVLAGTLIALRAAGQELGWGFQLQSPVFLCALVFLLTGFSLNLLGVFEIGDSLMGVGQKWASREGWAGTFFSGVLATVVATPCTAPFMGTAVGYALSQPAALSLAIFTSLGLGLAAPYVVFSLFPKLTQRLPRPGAWMVIFKQLMAFPLLLTAWWLVSVLALQTSLTALFQVLLALILFSMGLWIYGLKVRSRYTRLALAALFVLVPIGWSLTSVHGVPVGNLTEGKKESDGWLAYSNAALEQARASGNPVFIDFTAAWCITCIVNERVALNTEVVRARFAEKKVVLFKADWTNQDKEISQKLESFGRNGVPLYVLYPPGPKSEARILPQILTPETVLTALDAL